MAGENFVFFRFEQELKNGYKTVVSTSPVVGIPMEALDAVPMSLLSVLKEARWKGDLLDEDDNCGRPGTSALKPISVDMSKAPCREEWNSDLAEWLGEVYEAHLDEPVSIKVPRGTELADAWVVLDYFGLAPDDPSFLDIDECSTIVKIRAAIFLKDVSKMKSAKDYVVDSFIQDSVREKLFVFIDPSKHDMHCIKNENYKGRAPVLPVGTNDEDAASNFEWIQNPRLRESFKGELVEEGFTVDFLRKFEFSDELRQDAEDYKFEGDASDFVECYNCGKCGHYARSCPDGDWRYRLKYSKIEKHKCWAIYKEKNKEFDFEPMIVMKVVVPMT